MNLWRGLQGQKIVAWEESVFRTAVGIALVILKTSTKRLFYGYCP